MALLLEAGASPDGNRRPQRAHTERFGHVYSAPLHLALLGGDADEGRGGEGPGGGEERRETDEAGAAEATRQAPGESSAGGAAADVAAGGRRVRPDALAVVKLLLAARADANRRDQLGRTPLRVASAAGLAEAVVLLEAAGARRDDEPRAGSARHREEAAVAPEAAAASGAPAQAGAEKPWLRARCWAAASSGWVWPPGVAPQKLSWELTDPDLILCRGHF